MIERNDDLLERIADLERRLTEVEQWPHLIAAAFKAAATRDDCAPARASEPDDLQTAEPAPASSSADDRDVDAAGDVLARVSTESKATLQRVQALQGLMRTQAVRPPTELQLALRGLLRELK
jgi:hypothetical protein